MDLNINSRYQFKASSRQTPLRTKMDSIDFQVVFVSNGFARHLYHKGFRNHRAILNITWNIEPETEVWIKQVQDYDIQSMAREFEKFNIAIFNIKIQD
jgi:hypothetical protein